MKARKKGIRTRSRDERGQSIGRFGGSGLSKKREGTELCLLWTKE